MRSKETSSQQPAIGRTGRRALSFRVAAVCGALLAALLICELALWLFAPLGSNQWLYWRADGHLKGVPEPNQTLGTAGGGTVRLNSMGFRGPDYGWSPAPGTLRLAAFGGSSTFGFDADDRTTWPYLLQQLLNDALDMPVEVVNLGLPGYDNFTSKVNYMVHGRALHPHVVLVCHTWNDMKFFRELERGPILRARTTPNRSIWARMARRTQLARRLARVYRTFDERAIENRYTSLDEEGTGAALPPTEPAFDWARANFVDFVSLALGDGRLAVLITQPTLAVPANVDDHEMRRRIREDYVGMTVPILADTWIRMNRVISEVADEHDAIFADAYTSVPHDLEHFVDTVHLTKQGRSALAQVIAAQLLEDHRFLSVAHKVRDAAVTKGTIP